MKKTFSIIALTLSGFYISAPCEDKIKSFSFTPLQVSNTENEKKHLRVSEHLHVITENGKKKSFPLSYKMILQSGKKINEQVFAQVTRKDNKPILMKDKSSFISNNPDSNSILKVGEKNYLITHFEEEPGQLYKTELSLKNNKIIPKSTQPIDLQEIGGTITNCAGSTTPWNTHLGGEEDYYLNTRYADKNSPYYIACEKNDKNSFNGNDSLGVANHFCSSVAAMQNYLQDQDIDTDGYNGRLFTPYNYGYIIEIDVKDDGKTEAAKHYVSGKYTPELAVGMPDQKTFYMSDDGNAKGLYKFVSDKPITKFRKNWQGSLYGAKLEQLSSKDGGSFKIEWIKLGNASDYELRKLIIKQLKLSDMFNIQKDLNETCADGYTKVFEDGEAECLQLRTGAQRSKVFETDDEVKRAAAFLETRKYGAYLGATMEFNKEEGLTYDKDKNSIYVAMSQIANSMENNIGKNETTNDIRVEKNSCGAIYTLALDETYSAVTMSPLLVGKPLKKTDQYADEYSCDPNSVANPDNIVYIGSDSLLIGEDTTLHLNNFLWIYNTKTKESTRIASLPIGAEVTGIALSKIENKQAIIFNIQHPFQDNPVNAEGGTPNSYILQKSTGNDLKGSIGYIDGLPLQLFE